MSADYNAMSLYVELRDRVKSHGFTARQLAEVSGYSQTHILKVFRGTYEPGSIMFWQSLLDACKVLVKKGEHSVVLLCGPPDSSPDYTGINSPTGRCPKHGDYLYFCQECHDGH